MHFIKDCIYFLLLVTFSSASAREVSDLKTNEISRENDPVIALLTTQRSLPPRDTFHVTNVEVHSSSAVDGEPAPSGHKPGEITNLEAHQLSGGHKLPNDVEVFEQKDGPSNAKQEEEQKEENGDGAAADEEPEAVSNAEPEAVPETEAETQVAAAEAVTEAAEDTKPETEAEVAAEPEAEPAADPEPAAEEETAPEPEAASEPETEPAAAAEAGDASEDANEAAPAAEPETPGPAEPEVAAETVTEPAEPQAEPEPESPPADDAGSSANNEPSKPVETNDMDEGMQNDGPAVEATVGPAAVDGEKSPTAAEEPTNTCYSCDSEDDSVCRDKPTTTKNCQKQAGEKSSVHIGCYAIFKGDTNSTIRGCLEELPEESIRSCLKGDKYCTLCYSNNCNSKKVPNGATALQWSSWILVSWIFVKIVNGDIVKYL